MAAVPAAFFLREYFAPMRRTDVITPMSSQYGDSADDTVFHMLRLNRTTADTIIERHPTADPS